MEQAPNEQDLKNVFLNQGFSFNIWIDAPGQEWIGFTHGVDERVVVLEGDVLFRIAGKTVVPAIGEEVFIPAGAVHDVVNIGKTHCRWAYGYRREE